MAWKNKAEKRGHQNGTGRGENITTEHPAMQGVTPFNLQEDGHTYED